MTDAELVMLRAIWEEQDAHAREDAWQQVKAIVKERKRGGLIEDGRARLAAWINNYSTIPYPQVTQTFSGMGGSNVRSAALPPLLDALAAAVAADMLDSRQQTLLLEPITAITRKPARP